MISMETATASQNKRDSVNTTAVETLQNSIKVEQLEVDSQGSGKEDSCLESEPDSRSTEFIEFEFNPDDIEKSPTKSPRKPAATRRFYREGSESSAEEEVLDSIFDAAARGDTESLNNLIYAKPDQGKVNSKLDLLQEGFPSQRKVNHSKRSLESVTNSLKRKLSPELDENAGLSTTKQLLDSVTFDNVVNTIDSQLLPKRKKPRILKHRQGSEQKDSNLIDFGVLTKALSRTLETKLKDGQDNDVKIVIFCNNKPVQSFSVKCNSKSGTKSLSNQNSTDQAPESNLPYGLHENGCVGNIPVATKTSQLSRNVVTKSVTESVTNSSSTAAVSTPQTVSGPTEKDGSDQSVKSVPLSTSSAITVTRLQPNTVVTTGSQPNTLVTTGSQSNSLITTILQPNTVVTTGSQSNSLITTILQPNTEVTTSSQLSTVVTAGSQPTSLVTAGSQPTNLVTAGYFPTSLVTAGSQLNINATVGSKLNSVVTTNLQSGVRVPNTVVIGSNKSNSPRTLHIAPAPFPKAGTVIEQNKVVFLQPASSGSSPLYGAPVTLTSATNGAASLKPETSAAGRSTSVKIPLASDGPPLSGLFPDGSVLVKTIDGQLRRVLPSSTGASKNQVDRPLKQELPNSSETQSDNNIKNKKVTTSPSEIKKKLGNSHWYNPQTFKFEIPRHAYAKSQVKEDKLRVVTCNLCHKTFKRKRYLNRHKIRVHRETCDITEALPSAEVKEEAASNSRESSPKSEADDNSLDSETSEKAGNQTKKFVNLADLLPKSSSKLDGDGGLNVRFKEEDEDSGDSSDLDLSRVKREPSTESSDDSVAKYIRSLIDENDMILEDIANPAPFVPKRRKSKTSDDDKTKGLLNLERKKPYRLQRTDKGLPLSFDGKIEPVYVCEECGKFYRARKTLKDHYFRSHAKNKDDEPLYLYISGNKYQCPICFSNFHSGSELVAHTKKHTGELHIPCKLCGKVYSSVHVLRRHIEVVHAETRPRPFQCPLCDYAATNKWHLKEHYRRHTGEQPYQCPVCMKPFSHQGTMNRHCKAVHQFEISSQRQFAKNTVSDLPVLSGPLGAGASEDGTGDPTKSSSFEDSHINYVLNVTDFDQAEGEAKDRESSFLEDGESDSESNLEIDLSIVKTEPEEAQVDVD